MKRIGALVLTAVLLASCGGVGSSDEPSSGGGGGKVSGQIRTMGFGQEDVIAKTRVKEVRSQYPDLDIKVNSGGFDEQQFLSAVASGEPPDVVYLDRSELSSYAARGALTPMDDCIASRGLDMGLYREAAVNQVTYKDQIYAIPEFNGVRIMLENTQALDDVGMSAGDLSTTDWTSLESAATKLEKSSGSDIERIGFDPKIPEFLPLWSAANGGQLLSEDGLSAELNSPENVEALDYAASLVDKQQGWAKFKAFRDTWDFFGDSNQFVEDQVGAFPMEDWYLDVLADVSPDAPVHAEAFTDRDGNPLTYATGLAWAIPKGAANPDAACAFAISMTATDTWLAAARASKADREKNGGFYLGTWTANTEADKKIFDEVYEPSGQESLDQAVKVVQSVQSVAVVDPPCPAAAEVKKAWEDASLRVLEGDQTAQESLDQAQEEAQAAIDEASQ